MGFWDTCSDCKYFNGKKHPYYRSGDGDLSVVTPKYNYGYCTSKGEYIDEHSSPCGRFVKGSYDSGCFLTSACVEYRGLNDDCYELTTLRNFRDGYLKSTEEGLKLVQEYYNIAPNIVKKLKTMQNKGEVFDFIYGEILKCISLINAGENDGAVNTYRNMVTKVAKIVG